jgi:iron complex outermembrane receptor protein
MKARIPLCTGRLPARSALALSIASTLLVVAPAVCAGVQSDADDAEARQSRVTEIDAIQVVGSRLRKSDAETALPVTVYTEADIKATGQPTIAEVLRTLPYNTQGTSTPRPGSTGQGVTDVNLRGLGYGRTLTLINGRRIPVDSTFFGFGVSTSFIPAGAVERIEVLRDGASAIYGSDALGGVVNIVLKDRFEGAETSVSLANPTAPGGNAWVANATAGLDGERGGLVVSLEKRRIDALRNSSREALRSDYSNLGFGFLGNSFPPTYRVTDFFGDGSNVAGPYATGAGCDPARLSSGGPLTLVHPVTGQTVTVSGQSECRNPVSDMTDHTPEFDVRSAYLSGSWNLAGNFRLFGEVLAVNQDTLGRREPVTGSLTLAAGNPGNPTSGATAGNPVAGVTSPRAVSVLYALPDEYARELFTESGQRHYVGGFEWTPAAGTLTGYYQYANQTADSHYRNALHVAPFNAAVASGQLNLFDPGARGAYAAFLQTGLRRTETALDAAGLDWTSELPFLELPGGAIQYGLGYEWRKETILETCDPLSASYAISGGFCFQFDTGREVSAAYLELALPILPNLELDYAGRWDSYDVPDFSEPTHRVAVRYQPLPSLTLRGSYSEGIRAPNLYEINSSSGLTTSTVVDTRACTAAGGNPADPACLPIQVQQILKGGPDLLPEQSRTVSWGAVWAPDNRFSIAADFYKVRIDNQIQNLGNQTVVDLEAQGFDLSRYSVALERDGNGRIVSVTSGSANVPGFSTSGVDVETALNLDFGDYGSLRSRLVASWIRDFKRPAAPGAQVFDAVGYVNQPEFLGALNNTWQRGEWSFNLRFNYVGSYDARSVEADRRLGVPSQGRIGAYSTADFSVTYQAPWNARITLGARNLTDRLPDINRYAYGNLGYSTALSDINGRVLLLSYTQALK